MFFSSRVLLGATKLSSITSKRGNKNFYKGRGAKSIGYRTKHGRFTFDPSKFARISFIAPDLTGFTLKAYVAPTTPLVGRDGSALPPKTAQSTAAAT